GDRNPRAFVCEHVGGGAPHAAGSTGDHRDPSGDRTAPSRQAWAHGAGQYFAGMAAPVVAAEAYSAADWLLALVTATFACIPLGVWAWALAGRRRVAWIAAILLGIFTVVGGLLISGYYLASVRPRIAAAERGEVA